MTVGGKDPAVQRPGTCSQRVAEAPMRARSALLIGPWLLSVALLLAAPAGWAAKPDFALPDLQGAEHRLSDYRGQWVLVNYWATWCPPCLEEMPELEMFHNEHKDHNAVVLGVNMEDIPLERLQAFVEEQFVSYPILRRRPAGQTAFGRISGMPTSFLVAPDGEVVARQVGTVTAEAIERFIDDYKQGEEGTEP